MREQEQHLSKLQQDRAQLQRGLQTQRVQLAALLRAADQLGRNAPLKVLLSQDTVGDATRRLADHRYVQNARAQRIQALTTQLQALAKVEQDIASRRQALDSARAQQKRKPLRCRRIARSRRSPSPSWTIATNNAPNAKKPWARTPSRWSSCSPICARPPPRPKPNAARLPNAPLPKRPRRQSAPKPIAPIVPTGRARRRPRSSPARRPPRSVG